MTREEFMEQLQQEYDKKLAAFDFAQSCGTVYSGLTKNIHITCSYAQMVEKLKEMKRSGNSITFKQYFESLDDLIVDYINNSKDITILFHLTGDFEENVRLVSNGKCKVVKELKETSHIVCDI